MKRMIQVLAAGFGALLFATSPASAKDAPTAATPSVTVASPVTSEVVSDGTTTRRARRGLFARIRDRRANRGSTYATPTTGTIVAPTAAPATAVPTPMPTPGLTPASGTTSAPMVTTAAYTVRQPVRTGLFGRTIYRNRTMPMTMTPSPLPMNSVVPVAGTVVTSSPTAMPTTTTTTRRMGLLGRLRSRR